MYSGGVSAFMEREGLAKILGRGQNDELRLVSTTFYVEILIGA